MNSTSPSSCDEHYRRLHHAASSAPFQKHHESDSMMMIEAESSSGFFFASPTSPLKSNAATTSTTSSSTATLDNKHQNGWIPFRFANNTTKGSYTYEKNSRNNLPYCKTEKNPLTSFCSEPTLKKSRSISGSTTSSYNRTINLVQQTIRNPNQARKSNTDKESMSKWHKLLANSASSLTTTRTTNNHHHHGAVASTTSNCNERSKMVAKEQRHKAAKMMTFYHECFSRGIKPNEAEMAAKYVESKYREWWNYSTSAVQVEDQPQQVASSAAACRNDVFHNNKYKAASMSTTYSNLLFLQQQQLNNSHEHLLIHEKKMLMIKTMSTTRGDTKDPTFLNCLFVLHSFYQSKGYDARWGQRRVINIMDGTWKTISEPNNIESCGENESNQSLYRLGRISFGIFQPENLICSVQTTRLDVSTIDENNMDISDQSSSSPRIPRKFKLQAEKLSTTTRKYDIQVDLTIEPNQNKTGQKVTTVNNNQDCTYNDLIVSQPIRCTMSHHGYALPDPSIANRISIWFSDGSIKISKQDKNKYFDIWKSIFGGNNSSTTAATASYSKEENITMTTEARRLAVRFLLGLVVADTVNDENGEVGYVLKNPVGGHGHAYVDVLYMDQDFCIMKGKSGCINVVVAQE